MQLRSRNCANPKENKLVRKKEQTSTKVISKGKEGKARFHQGAPNTLKNNMATAAAPPSGGGVHFVVPDGTVLITQPDLASGIGHDSWREWGLDKEMVTSVTIPPSVTRIGRNAFVKFSLLTAVAIPTSVTSLGSAANGPASLMMRSGAHTRTMVVGGGVSSPLYSSFVSSAITFPASSPQVEAPSTTFTSPVVLPAAGLMMTAANAPHLANARALMSVVEAEIVTLSKELHRSKAPSPMLDTEVGMSALINEQHSMKAP